MPPIHRSALVAALTLCLVPGTARAQSSPLGVWKTIHDETRVERSLVRITLANGVYSGRIERLLDPALKPDAVCGRCNDERRDKPLVGLLVFSGVRPSRSDPAVWDGGEILDPNNGKTFAVRLTLAEGGKRLEVRGYVGTPMFGRTQNWVRVE